MWPKKSPGRPPKATPEFRNAVDESARQNPRELGCDFTRWTTDLMAEHLASTTGIRIAPGTLRGILADLGFRWGRPKLDLKHRQYPRDVARAKRLRSGALKNDSQRRTLRLSLSGRSGIPSQPGIVRVLVASRRTCDCPVGRTESPRSCLWSVGRDLGGSHCVAHAEEMRSGLYRLLGLLADQALLRLRSCLSVPRQLFDSPHQGSSAIPG